MADTVMGSPIKKVYGETVSLTTTASHLLFRPTYHEVMMYCSSQWRMGIAPRLASVQYYNGTTYTDHTSKALDRVSTTHVPLDAMAATHILYMGIVEPVRGFYYTIDETNKNAETATLDFEYCSSIADGVGTFSDVASDSDGTDTTGATLNVSGLYSFTLPAVVRGIITALSSQSLYWYRFKPSAALSATVDLVDIIPACEDTNYAYMEPAVVYQFSLNVTQNGAFEFDHASTGTLDVSWIKH